MTATRQTKPATSWLRPTLFAFAILLLLILAAVIAQHGKAVGGLDASASRRLRIAVLILAPLLATIVVLWLARRTAPWFLSDGTTYTMYQNGPGAPRAGAKASQAILNGMALGSTSLFCLGCHDGSAAPNSYGNAAPLASDRGPPMIGAPQAMGANGSLANHHPVGFDYDAVQAEDAEIRPADFAQLTPSTTVRDHLYGPAAAKVECGTCHSVHNIGNGGEALLWRSDARSTLCLTCHAKGMYTAPY